VTSLPTAPEALAAAEPPVRRCLELAFDALRAGGLACGSVVVAPDWTISAEGRNHAYDPPTGSDVLEGSPLAHAELNALARVPTGLDLGALTLWSSQEPCSMCTAAAQFVGVGGIRYLAPDPWAIAAVMPDPPLFGDGAAATIWPSPPTMKWFLWHVRQRR
jgi:tRNA(Arg) A34 adenosine deaminase TadA